MNGRSTVPHPLVLDSSDGALSGPLASRTRWCGTVLLRLRTLAALAALASTLGAQVQRFDPAQDVGFDQRLGERLPRDARFRDEEGREIALGALFDERPIVLALVYYRCPMLCTLVLNGLVASLQAVDLEAGRDFRVIAVSIDPRETPELAAEKRARVVASYGRAGSEGGWRFLTGDEESIRSLAGAAGFRYAYDERADEYAHASGVVVATPEGELSHYFYGVEYSAPDLRLALVEASQGRIGTAVDRLLLLCYHYDPMTGTYGVVILTVIRMFAILTVVLMAVLVFGLLRRERRTLHAQAGGS